MHNNIVVIVHFKKPHWQYDNIAHMQFCWNLEVRMCIYLIFLHINKYFYYSKHIQIYHKHQLILDSNWFKKLYSHGAPWNATIKHSIFFHSTNLTIIYCFTFDSINNMRLKPRYVNITRKSSKLKRANIIHKPFWQSK